LVHNYRRGGKVKTRTLEYLGKEPPSAETLARLREKHGKPGTQMALALTPPDAVAGNREAHTEPAPECETPAQASAKAGTGEETTAQQR